MANAPQVREALSAFMKSIQPRHKGSSRRYSTVRGMPAHLDIAGQIAESLATVVPSFLPAASMTTRRQVQQLTPDMVRRIFKLALPQTKQGGTGNVR